jgi:hypothetical protein
MADADTVNVKLQPGNNDDEKIKNALNQLTNGGILLFPNGIYTPTTTINIVSSNIIVVISEGATIKVTNFNAKLFYVSGNNVVFNGGGTIDLTKTGVLWNDSFAAIYFLNSNISGVEKITIKNTDNIGIKFDTCTNCFANNCILLACYSGIVDYNSQYTRITKNIVDKLASPGNALTTGSDRGIRGNQAINMFITENKIKGYSLCLELYYHCHQSIINNNIIEDTGFAISLDQSNNCIISTNILSSTSISLTIVTMIELAESKYCIVNANRIQILNNIGGKGIGIGIWGAETGDSNVGSDYSIVTDNVINNSDNGIVIAFSKYVEVKNNSIININIDGIVFSNTLSAYCSITDNTIHTSKRYGIFIPPDRNYNNIEISNNSIFNSGNDSIEVQGSLNPSNIAIVNNNIRILNNNIIGSSMRGISATFSKGDIQGNIIRECRKSGIYLMTCNNVSGYLTLHDNSVIDCVLDTLPNEAGIYINYIYSAVVLDMKNNYSPNEKNNNIGEFIYNVTGKVTNFYVFVTALPSPYIGWRGKSIVLQGGTGVPDKVYTLMKNASGTYTWVQNITG